MKISIQNQLFMAMLVATLSIVGFMAIVIQWSFDRGFVEYVNIEERAEIDRLARQLERYYAKNRSWHNLVADPREVLKLHALVLPAEKLKHPDHDHPDHQKIPEWMTRPGPKSAEFRRHPIERTVILDEQGSLFFGGKIGERLPKLQPLMYDGTQVGSIGLYPPRKLSEANQLMFLEKQKTVIIGICAAAVIVTILISMTLAYQLTKPIRQLSVAAKKLIDGDYATRVTAGASTELQQLANDFNVLAQTLEENEYQRKMWVSDIAHELRTPLTGLKGEIEALQDGIRKPGQRTYENLHKGVARLQRLVEDLYDLSRSDLGTFTVITEKVNLSRLVSLEVNSQIAAAEKAELTLNMHNVRGIQAGVTVPGDSGRLQQLIANLLTNSIRYTDRGGTVDVTVRLDGGQAILEVEDSAPGVPDEALPRLFNRLFRVEQSRNRALGGSGLGLAICQQIVHAHQGTINASHSASGGLKISVHLPALTEKTS